MSLQLLTEVTAGDLHLPNRIVMAPMTRTRADADHVPGELMLRYYAQRASAGLLIGEATMVTADAAAFINEPGLYGAAQASGWKRVTDAVHAAGGRIAAQLWHPGRATHADINGGRQPVSSSDRAIRDADIRTPTGRHPYPAPRRLRSDELPGIVAAFRQAAVHARQAGFDAVQIHGAHGYLLDQFLRDSVNDRDDEYGGSIAKRARLLFEAVDAAIEVFGAGRVGLRISPLEPFNDIRDSDPRNLVAYVAEQAQQRALAFFDLRHSQHEHPDERELARIVRGIYRGTLMLNGGFTRDSAEAALRDGLADAIQFGKPFIANPDLVERFRRDAALNALDPNTIYGEGPHGYTDYPTLDS